jgi:3-oxoacyl-[acyl-carrier-protein] synthase III
MPPVRIGPIEGIGVLGAWTAFPALTLDNAQALGVLPSARPRSPEQLAFAAAGLRQSVGLASRSWAHRVGTPLDHANEETTLDLGLRAARAALLDAGVSADQVGLLLVATSTPSRMTSTLSAPMGHALGLNAACMDTRTGCAAGLFALSTAALHVAAGVGYAVVVGTETFSKVVPPTHKMGVMSLGDGAGAIVLGPKPGAAVLGLHLESDGGLAGLIGTQGALPPTVDELERGGYLLSGEPEALADALPAKYLRAMEGALGRAGLSAGALDAYVPHQTSLPLIDAVADRLGVPAEKVWREGVGRHANVGAAGWLVGFAEARAAGRFGDGDRVAVASVGGGMSWAAAVLRC